MDFLSLKLRLAEMQRTAIKAREVSRIYRATILLSNSCE